MDLTMKYDGESLDYVCVGFRVVRRVRNAIRYSLVKTGRRRKKL